jgi:hypothetical protein
MRRKQASAIACVCGLAIAGWVGLAAAADEPLPPASDWIRQDAFLVVEVTDPEALVDLAVGPKVTSAVTSLPAYQAVMAQPGFQQFQQVIRHLETSLDVEWLPGLKSLVGGGVTFAVCPDESVLLVIDSDDAERLNKLHEILMNFARGQGALKGQGDPISSGEYRGVTGWTFGGDEAHCIVGNRVMISNKPAALKAALDRRADPGGPNLSKSPGYQAAKKAAGEKAAAVAFVNMAAIKQAPQIAKLLSAGPNPAASLLIPGVTEALAESTWAAIGLCAADETLSLKAVINSEGDDNSGAIPFAKPSKPGDGAMPNLSVPRQIAGLSFYRDLHMFYGAKDDLFPQRTSGLIFFENMMGIFFTGRDLTDEILAETEPDVRFVVAEQAYDPTIGIPKLQMPSFAMVLRLKHPDKFGEVAEEAWQKFLGLMNFTRGQQAEPGLILDRPVHEGVVFSASRFASVDTDDKSNVDSRFNFRPSLAMPGDFLILSSTESLARDLIDALNREVAGEVKALADTQSLVEVNGAQLASILSANRDNLVRQNMVSDGNTLEEAQFQIDLLLTIAKFFDNARIDLGANDGQTHASVEVKFDLSSK